MKLRIAIAVFLTAVFGLVAGTAPAQATVTNGRAPTTCTLAGTVWNIADLYHRDSSSGSVQSFGFAISRKSGTGKLSQVILSSTGSSLTAWEGQWGSPYITAIPDTLFNNTPSWGASQTVYFNLTSPSSSGNQSIQCSIFIT